MESLEKNGITATEQSTEQFDAVVTGTNNLEQPATEWTPKSKEEVMARAKELATHENATNKATMEELKRAFYHFHNAEIQQARKQFIEEGGEVDNFVPQLDVCEPEFRSLMQILREKRAKELELQERLKQEGLTRKLEILDQIQQLATTPEEANQHFDQFKLLQTEWKEIKNVPAERNSELWKNFQLYTEQFYDLLKLGHELREYDFKKNLDIKTRLCEQAEALQNEEDIVRANNQLQALHQEWKETGPVAKEIREEIWTRFKDASTIIRKKHQAHFESRKLEEESNLAKKEALCVTIEGIHTQELSNYAQWDEMTKKVIECQTEWRNIGFAPQKMNTSVYERFRKACDRFFELKSNFYQQVKEEYNQNLARKKELVEKAEALTNSTEWKAATEQFIQLQKEWKEVGNIPRKNAEKLWTRFIAACDHFFAEKQKAGAGVHEEQSENLKKKQAIITSLQVLATSEEAEDLIQKVKDLQKEWNAIGHVPFAEKDKLYKQYRKIVDELYEAHSSQQHKRRLNQFKDSLANKAEGGNGSLASDRTKMMRAYENMKAEIKTYENNLGFLSSNSKKGNNLVDIMKKKVERLHNELSLLAKKIQAIDEEIKKGEA